MPCYHPISGWLSRNFTPAGKRTVVFNPRDGLIDRPVTIPCGQCIGCRLERSRQWAIRCVHEASLHEQNCFITLTYDDEHIPSDGSLKLDDLQRFFKRLRKRIYPHKVRYYAAGEYGEQLERPHYHACLFGWRPEDLEIIRQNHDGSYLYISSFLSEIWPNGFNSVGDVTFESAAYVARYVTKKITGKQALKTDEDGLTPYQREYIDVLTGEVTVHDVTPEFVTMSRRPGIGKGWLEKYGSDVLSYDEVIINGKPCKPPKYYDRCFEKTDIERITYLKAKRKAAALANPERTDIDRLYAAETIKEQTVKKSLKRTYEKN